MLRILEMGGQVKVAQVRHWWSLIGIKILILMSGLCLVGWGFSTSLPTKILNSSDYRAASAKLFCDQVEFSLDNIEQCILEVQLTHLNDQQSKRFNFRLLSFGGSPLRELADKTNNKQGHLYYYSLQALESPNVLLVGYVFIATRPTRNWIGKQKVKLGIRGDLRLKEENGDSISLSLDSFY